MEYTVKRHEEDEHGNSLKTPFYTIEGVPFRAYLSEYKAERIAEELRSGVREEISLSLKQNYPLTPSLSERERSELLNQRTPSDFAATTEKLKDARRGEVPAYWQEDVETLRLFRALNSGEPGDSSGAINKKGPPKS